jgi:hypothetical protein
MYRTTVLQTNFELSELNSPLRYDIHAVKSYKNDSCGGWGRYVCDSSDNSTKTFVSIT